MKRACVIGWPVAHSRSPVIHRYWLKLYGPDGAYELDFGAPVRIDHLELREVLEAGQCVTGHRVRHPHGHDPTGGQPDRDTTFARGLTIGARRIHVFEAVEADRLRVELDGDGARLEAAIGYGTGAEHVPSIEYEAPTERPDAHEKHA